MKVACEKPDCYETAVAQARLEEVTVARACEGHWSALVNFINQHMGASDVVLVGQPVVQNGAR